MHYCVFSLFYFILIYFFKNKKGDKKHKKEESKRKSYEMCLEKQAEILSAKMPECFNDFTEKCEKKYEETKKYCAK